MFTTGKGKRDGAKTPPPLPPEPAPAPEIPLEERPSFKEAIDTGNQLSRAWSKVKEMREGMKGKIRNSNL